MVNCFSLSFGLITLSKNVGCSAYQSHESFLLDVVIKSLPGNVSKFWEAEYDKINCLDRTLQFTIRVPFSLQVVNYSWDIRNQILKRYFFACYLPIKRQAYVLLTDKRLFVVQENKKILEKFAAMTNCNHFFWGPHVHFSTVS